MNHKDKKSGVNQSCCNDHYVVTGLKTRTNDVKTGEGWKVASSNVSKAYNSRLSIK